MVGLDADAEDAALAHRVAAARDVANAAGGQHQILVAHQLGNRRRHLGTMARREPTEFFLVDRIVEEIFAELADGQTAQRPEGVVVEAVEKKTADVIAVGVDERVVDDVAERNVGEDDLGGERSRSERAASPARASPDFSSLALAKTSRRSAKAKRSLRIVEDQPMTGPLGPLLGHGCRPSRIIDYGHFPEQSRVPLLEMVIEIGP